MHSCKKKSPTEKIPSGKIIEKNCFLFCYFTFYNLNFVFDYTNSKYPFLIAKFGFCDYTSTGASPLKKTAPFREA